MAEEIIMKPIDAVAGKETPLIKIGLTSYEWHELLKELEYLRCICNRDQDTCIELWEKISSALSSKNHIVYGSDKHRKLEPEYFSAKFKAEQALKETPKEEEKPKKKCLFEKLFDTWNRKRY